MRPNLDVLELDHILVRLARADSGLSPGLVLQNELLEGHERLAVPQNARNLGPPGRSGAKCSKIPR